MSHWPFCCRGDLTAVRHMVAAMRWHERRGEPFALGERAWTDRQDRALMAFDARWRYAHQRRMRQ